jgi:hypothetical protein
MLAVDLDLAVMRTNLLVRTDAMEASVLKRTFVR